MQINLIDFTSSNLNRRFIPDLINITDISTILLVFTYFVSFYSFKYRKSIRSGSMKLHIKTIDKCSKLAVRLSVLFNIIDLIFYLLLLRYSPLDINHYSSFLSCFIPLNSRKNIVLLKNQAFLVVYSMKFMFSLVIFYVSHIDQSDAMLTMKFGLSPFLYYAILYILKTHISIPLIMQKVYETSILKTFILCTATSISLMFFDLFFCSLKKKNYWRLCLSRTIKFHQKLIQTILDKVIDFSKKAFHC